MASSKLNSMKLVILSVSTSIGFLVSYLHNLSLEHIESYLIIVLSLFLDGLFGIIAGVKREGFKTFKSLKLLKNLVMWSTLLSFILVAEVNFEVYWLSETMLFPFMTFQLISIVKNISMSGFIKNEKLNSLLDRVDRHKGERK
jgi:hypothetical protein